jgi:hypothetical protein
VFPRADDDDAELEPSVRGLSDGDSNPESTQHQLVGEYLSENEGIEDSVREVNLECAEQTMGDEVLVVTVATLGHSAIGGGEGTLGEDEELSFSTPYWSRIPDLPLEIPFGRRLGRGVERFGLPIEGRDGPIGPPRRIRGCYDWECPYDHSPTYAVWDVGLTGEIDGETEPERELGNWEPVVGILDLPNCVRTNVLVHV